MGALRTHPSRETHPTWRRAALVVAAASAGALGCSAPTAFECDATATCDRAPGGRCEHDGRCSYLDAACPSGRRYGGLAGAEAGACVAEGGPAPDARGVDDGGPGGVDASTPRPDASVSLARVSAGVLALYDFEDGSGTTVSDTSGAGSPLDLTIADLANVTWAADSLRIDSPTIVSSAGAATKIIDACKASNELTIEAWVTAPNTTQTGPARIATISSGTQLRNTTLGVEALRYDGRVRTSAATDNGLPSLPTPDGDVAPVLTHVVLTRAAGGERRLYVDGVERAQDNPGGDFATWAAYPLALANETTNNRPWLGELHLVALFCRQLSAGEIAQNFGAGHLAP